MRMNVTGLEIRKRSNKLGEYVTFRLLSEDMEREGEDWPRRLVLSADEARDGIECLRGQAAYDPYFDDGIHLVQLWPRGIVEIYAYAGKSKQYVFTLPGEWLADRLEGMLDALEDEVEYVATKQELAALREQCAPVIKWVYNKGVQERLQTQLDDERVTGLTDGIEVLHQIAENHSDGSPSEIRMCFDVAHKSSYSFAIYHADGSRVIHGGLIGWYDEEKEVLVYSVHT